MNKPEVLVIEDDHAIGNLIGTALESQECSYHVARTGSAGIAEALSAQPSVILLDLGLPDMDGVDIIKKMRGFSHVPIIVVSARSEDADKVAALDAGADDWHPCRPIERQANCNLTHFRRPNHCDFTSAAVDHEPIVLKHVAAEEAIKLRFG